MSTLKEGGGASDGQWFGHAGMGLDCLALGSMTSLKKLKFL